MTIVELERKIDLKVQEERRLTTEVIELIAQAEEHKLYALRGYPSLLEWLTKKYKYSEGSANRRIAAARLLRVDSQIKTKLEDGRLNLTTLAKAQSIIRKEEKLSRKPLPKEIKLKALEKIENQSTAKAEQTLFSLFPNAADHVKRDSVKVVDAQNMRLNANLPNDVMERFNQVRDLLSNVLPNASFVEAADYLFKKLIQENEAATAAAAKQCVNNGNKSVTARTKRIVLKEATCSYQDPVTGKVCGSRHQVQVDHIQPKALGGNNRQNNLRAVCATHNRLMAEQTLGKTWANRWRDRRTVEPQ